jgi:hypothetical protein
MRTDSEVLMREVAMKTVMRMGAGAGTLGTNILSGTHSICAECISLSNTMLF